LLGNPGHVRLRRRSTSSLSAHEWRVLEAFYAGRLPAGRLSEALATARRQPAPQALSRQPQPQPATVMVEPAPGLQLAA
jgi:hypothetical protein